MLTTFLNKFISLVSMIPHFGFIGKGVDTAIITVLTVPNTMP